MEPTVIQIAVDWFDKLGPYGFTLLVLLMVFLDDRGLLPKKLFKNRTGSMSIEGNGKREIEDIKRDINDLKVKLERRVEYNWIEREFKELKNELKEFITNVEKHLKEQIRAVHHRIDGIVR